MSLKKFFHGVFPLTLLQMCGGLLIDRSVCDRILKLSNDIPFKDHFRPDVAAALLGKFIAQSVNHLAL